MIEILGSIFFMSFMLPIIVLAIMGLQQGTWTD